MAQVGEEDIMPTKKSNEKTAKTGKSKAPSAAKKKAGKAVSEEELSEVSGGSLSFTRPGAARSIAWGGPTSQAGAQNVRPGVVRQGPTGGGG
jgi:hypothetical protein